LTAFIALTGGLLSFISPCVLPLLPCYIAYITGVSVSDIKKGIYSKPGLTMFLFSFIFVAGFTTAFTLMALLFDILFSSVPGSVKNIINIVAGAFIVIFGLKFTGIISGRILNKASTATPVKGKSSLLYAYTMGLAFGAGWTPCIGPVLAGIITLSALTAKSIAGAASMLVIYSLGLGIPFIITAVFTNHAIIFFSFFKRHGKAVETFSGIFLIILGLIIAFNKMDLLSALFSRL